MHVLSLHMFIGASDSASWLRDHFTIHLQAKKKEKTPPCKTISNSEPSCLVSQAVDPLLIKGCMQWGTHMGTCYFPHRRDALARHIFSLLNSTSVVCLLVKGAHSCATEHRGMRFVPSDSDPWRCICCLVCLLLILQAWSLSVLTMKCSLHWCYA